MIPWTMLAKAQTPGNGVELCLYQRGAEFSIKADTYELMNSRVHGSEDSLGTLACKNIATKPRARVLIGGLGMGYTVRSALDGLGTTAQVIVAELVPDVVQWNRGVLAELAGSPLDDSRVTVHETDVAKLITTAQGGYDAIMLDVDNGPWALTLDNNNWLYSRKGLETSFSALRPKGVLAIWSADPDPVFVRRLHTAGFQVDEVRARARGGRKGGGHHIVWIATRT